ncbi:MAG TPA: hypothetical protein VFN61_17065 [Acidimicrobiales bacterium]|nr:hypothetical protein [Acidimicrobiales bacterium]
MKLTVPAIATPEPQQPGSAQATSLLLEEIDALLAQLEHPAQGALGRTTGWPGPHPFTPAA